MNASFLENSNRWLKDLYNKTDSKRQKLDQKEITFQEDSSESLSKDRKKEWRSVKHISIYFTRHWQ